MTRRPSGPRALLLTGSLGMGHHVITEVVAGSFESLGWSTEVLDCMSLLGPVNSKLGDWVFRSLMSVPTVYDGIHFAHFRTGSRLPRAMDWAATHQLVPRLAERMTGGRFDVVLSTFATGASAIGKIAAGTDRVGRPAMVALCTDVTPHSLWVREGLELFLVTSPAAAAAVRRYTPRAPIAVVPPPVRAEFYSPPTKVEARRALGIDPDAPAVLLMGGGWGLGPLARTAELLAGNGVHVLAVAGRNQTLERALREVGRRQRLVHPFGFTDRVPALMAASDLVLTTAGATTCAETRVVGRPLLLLDVMPGHGRDNIQHELESGDADVCDPHPERLVPAVLASLERSAPRPVRRLEPDRFTAELADALAMVGIFPGGRRSRRPVTGRADRPAVAEEVD